MHIIGIVGTAKNTGKTTTLAALIAEAGRRRDRIAVTGIGYDGEEIDTITGLPKPRLLLQPGTIVATSEQCLRTASATYAVLKETEARTALGPVMIVEILTPGLMVLAGPNTKRLLDGLIGDLRTLGLSRLFVDGSLNRIAAMSVVDTIVFTTGASRSTEMLFLFEEARAICGLFLGKQCPRAHPAGDIELHDAAGGILGRLPMRSLFDAGDAAAVADAITDTTDAIDIPNMVSLQALEHLSARLGDAGHAGVTIAVADPIIALLAGEPIATFRWLQAASLLGIELGYRRPIRVTAMTVNPFYPQPRDHGFEPAFVDKDALLDGVRDAVDVPVFNIRDDGAASTLYELCYTPE